MYDLETSIFYKVIEMEVDVLFLREKKNYTDGYHR